MCILRKSHISSHVYELIGWHHVIECINALIWNTLSWKENIDIKSKFQTYQLQIFNKSAYNVILSFVVFLSVELLFHIYIWTNGVITAIPSYAWNWIICSEKKKCIHLNIFNCCYHSSKKSPGKFSLSKIIKDFVSIFRYICMR